VEKPEGKRPLERPRRRWEDNIRMNLKEVEWRTWIGSILLRWDRWPALVNAVMNVPVL
jgi:hypothetical protein